MRFPLNPLKLLAEGQPGQELTYSGISVDLEADRIFLDDKRRAKWAAKLRLALAADRLTAERIQSIHGIMQRVALVFPLGKCWLFSIRRLLAVSSLSRQGLKLAPHEREDVQLYVDYLSRPAAEIPPTPARTRNAALQTISRVPRRRGATVAAVHVPTDENWICDLATRTRLRHYAAAPPRCSARLRR